MQIRGPMDSTHAPIFAVIPAQIPKLSGGLMESAHAPTFATMA